MEGIREKIAASGSGFVPPPQLLESSTGVRGTHLREDGEQASDLAVRAVDQALEQAGTHIGEVDLLMFASASQDLMEPATAHIVAAKLGATCPVFDVKNACNSVLNAIEIACAFIESGRYRTIMIACGECPSIATRWRVPDRAAFLRALPGYTVSDAGAALLLTAGPAGDDDPGVLAVRFAAASAHWNACTVASGGTLHPRPTDDEPSYVQLNANGLRTAVIENLPRFIGRLGDDLERVRDSAFVAFHQTTRSQYDEVVGTLGLKPERCLPSVVEHGNVASASLPLQLVTALDEGRAEPGDTVTLLGMASGFSVGMALVRL